MAKVQFTEIGYNPFEGPAIDQIGSLTDPQKEVWLACALGGKEANLSYNECASLRLSGALRIEFIATACQFLVERHEALRMVFAPNGKDFMILEQMDTELFQQDFSTLNQKEQEQKNSEFLENEVHLEFDLKQGPLVRFSINKFSPLDYLFTITAHHLVVDGWSFGVMFEEIAHIYNALSEKKQINLPDADSFSKFALEMDEYSKTEDYKKVEKYWKEKYNPLPIPLELPIDRPRPRQRTFNGQRDDFRLSSEMVTSLKELGKKNNTSLVNTLMAAFEVFLYKLTGQEDIVLGLPAAGQAATDHLVLVGHCVNLLPLRTQIQPDLSFSKYLHKRKSELLDDYDHQHYTFGNLVKTLGIPRDPSRIPLVPVVFNIDMGMDDQVKFNGLEHTLISNPRAYENFEIFLNLTSSKEELAFEWSYNKDLFSKDTIAYWMNGLEDIIRQVTSNPNNTLSQIEFNRAWMESKLQEWNNTRLELPVQDSFLEIFWKNAKEYPKALALVANEKQIDYSSLRNLANIVSNKLTAQEIGEGDVVAVMVDRNENLLPALLGVLECGACYVPLDPGFPQERLAYMIADSGAKLLLTEPKYATKFPETIPTLLLESLKIPSDYVPKVKSCPKSQSLAYMLYTSGSTGLPKGVKITHLNLLNFLVSMQREPGMTSEDSLLAITTISFDIAGLELFLPLVCGASVVLATSEESKDGRQLFKLMDKHRVSMVQATPATWRMLMLSGWSSPRTLKLLCGGEALLADLAEKLLHLVGPFWNVYGPTETTVWSTIKQITDSSNINIGRPIANTQVYILDKNGKPCGVGAVGEICIGGMGVAQGYHNRTELTSEKFIKYPFPITKDDKCYRTGDLGRFLPSGEIVCLGRMDYQVKIRGFRIELGEIEVALVKQKSVREAVVLVRESADADTRLTAYIVFDKPGEKREESHWIKTTRKNLQESLPDYMIPQDWVFLDSLPLTANKKVDRKMLPEPKIEEKTIKDFEYLPQSPQEKLVVAAWEKVLKRKNLDLRSNFFELGGHSLAALEVMVLLENETGIKLPVNSIFKYPELKAFLSLFESDQTDAVSWKSIVPIKPSGSKIPLFLVHGAGANVTSFFGLAQHLAVEQPLYGIQSKGLDGLEDPLFTIEEMASYYLEEIRKVCPNGPFHIGGQSFGAYVAFEMAKQMKTKGEQIGKVFLFDVTAYQSETIMTGWEKVKFKLNHQIEKRVVDMKLAVYHPDSFMRMKSNSFSRKKGFIQKWLGMERDKVASNLFHTIEKIRKINHHAMDNYLLSRFDGEIVLIKAKIKTYLIEEKKYYGWSPFAKKVIPIEVEGDHNSMIDDPVLLINFAKELQAQLDSI